MLFVVLVVLVVLVVSGVQHVDCVAFSTLSFFLMKHVYNKRKIKKKRKGTRERKREREEEEKEKEEEQRERGRERERKREREIEKKVAFVNGFSFFAWLQDQLWKSLLQLWTVRTNILKWIVRSHGPVPWKFVEKLFFNKGLISGLILLGKAWALNLAFAFGKGLPFLSWLQDQLWKNVLQLWNLRTNLLKWIVRSHGPVPWKFVEKL